MSTGNGNGNGNGHHNGHSSHILDLSTHVAVVTGAARGIARATCEELGRSGAKAVGLVDMVDEVNTIARELNARLGRECFFAFAGDATSTEFRRGVFQTLEQKTGRPVSICVPAAGITRDRLAVKVDKATGATELYPEDDFRRVIDVDLTAPIYWALETIASVARERFRRGVKRWEPAEAVQGCIVLIGSVSSEGNKGQISYATAKAGLEGASATLAAEAIFHGVRSGIIHPGYTDTAMVRKLGEEFINQHIIPQTQLRRLIHPDEIANAIVFMIRNAAVSREMWVDAGWHPGA